MEASVREPQQEFMFLPLRQGQDTQMESEQSKGDCEGGFVACLPQFGWLAALDGNGEVRGSVNGRSNLCGSVRGRGKISVNGQDLEWIPFLIPIRLFLI